MMILATLDVITEPSDNPVPGPRRIKISRAETTYLSKAEGANFTPLSMREASELMLRIAMQQS
jgi:hypothetical protein